MSWFSAARNVISRWGTPARFAVRHVVAAAFPGGSIVGDLLDRLLECAQQTAKDQQEAEAHARTIASDEELRRVGEVLGEVNGRLSNLMEQVTHMEGLPDAADRLIRVALATDEAVRAGFTNLAGIVGRFDRVEEQGREILRRIGYGNDVQETILELLNRQSVVVDFVEELRAGGVQPRQLGEMLVMFNDCLAQARTGRASEALPSLRTIEAKRPQSATVQMTMAASASLTHDLRGAERALTKAVKLRPTDAKLLALSRSITQASSGLETPAQSTNATSGPCLGDVLDGWKLTQILGQGGWGQVFRAERAGHVRALKVLYPELSQRPGFEDNFKREILTLHSLGRQPYLVQFDTFGYARPQGHLYFLMEFIEGESLQTRLQRCGALSVAQAAHLFRQLAGEGGLAAAHAKGVVHRDIKPANILLRAKDGSPVLVDFGLALAGARGLSTINRVTGYTAMFAAPEQLRGKPADARSDIYSLVGSLFYAVTLQEPEEFEASRLPRELDALKDVLIRALDRRPDNRPNDAAALLKMLPVTKPATPKGPPEGKHVVSAPAIKPSPPTKEIQPEKWTCRSDAGPVHAVAFSSDGSKIAVAGKYQKLCLWTVGGRGEDRCFEAHTDSILSVAFFSSDGQKVLSASADNTICLWGSESSKPLMVLAGHHSPIHSLSVSPDQRLLAAGDADGVICFWELGSGKLVVRADGNGVVYGVAFSPDGSRLISCDKSGSIRLWDGKNGTLLKTVVRGEHRGRSGIYSVAWSPKDRLVLSGGHDRFLRLWDLNRGKQLRQFKGHNAAVRCVAFSPDGGIAVSGGGDKTVRLWDVTSGRLLRSFSEHGAAVRSVAVSPDGAWLLSGSLDGTVRLRSLKGA